MISLEGEVSTFLSESVYNTVVNLRKSSHATTFSCVTEDFLIDWNEVDYALGNISECGNILDCSDEWFLEKNKLLWTIINLVGEKCINSYKEEKLNCDNISFWFEDFNKGERIFKKFLSFDDNELLLCLLILTSRIERVLGNTAFLQLLLGCVHGLNLRNIAWHGFFSPGELHMNVIATLVLVLASLGQELKCLDIPRRPYFKFDSIQKHSEALRPFYFSLDFDLSTFQKAVINCEHIPSKQRQYWMYSVKLFLKGSFGDSLILVLPLIESLLRSVFCSANHYPRRMLTAESSVFYTTMDDILASKISTGANRLETLIGKELLEMLLDLFVYQEGPRLRDRISHAEIITTHISESIAKHTFGVAFSLMLTISNRPEADRLANESLFLELMNIPQKYEAQFHPFSILKSALINSLENVNSWNKNPFPEDLSSNVEDEVHLKLQNDLSGTLECNLNNISGVLDETKKELMHTYPSTLFRPKYELEFISLLRKITRNIEEINKNIELNFQKKYESWRERSMKSRVRDNYKRLINFMPLIQLTMVSLIFLMTKTLKRFQKQDENGVKNTQRFFKFCLQYAENGVSISDIKRNRWNELRESSITLCKLVSEKYHHYFKCDR